MIFKKILFSILAIFLGLSLGSCYDNNRVTVNNDVILKKEISLVNESEEYELTDNKLTAYFYEGGNVPLIGIEELITSLNGYFISNYMSVDINNKKEIVTYTYTDNSNYYFIVDAKNDVIKTNTTNFFSFIDAPIGIDYGSHFQGKGAYASEPSEIVFDLKPYSFDAFIYENDLILPLNILNYVVLLDSLSTIFYNRNYFTFYSNYIDDVSDYNRARNKELEGEKIPDDLLVARNNGLYFLLDYFYGLKDVKGISSFRDYIKNRPNIYNKLMSNYGREFDRGMVELLISDLDDPHTSVGFKSFYSPTSYFDDAYNKLASINDISYRTFNLLDKSDKLKEIYHEKFPNYKIVRFVGETAFIKFDKFLVGTDEEIYDANGNVRPDAWQYDTFYLFKNAFEEIEKHPEIKNVLIDLSSNGGGILSACINALGFLTNEDIILPSVDTLSKQKIIETYAVDSNDDGVFTDNDAYTNYNYYILTSNSTFSAANFFTSVCNDMGIATIIGEKSGGGMCGVGSTALLDGSTLSFSSNMSLSSAKKVNNQYEFQPIEFGIEVDHSIELAKFYDLAYLNKLISNDFK